EEGEEGGSDDDRYSQIPSLASIGEGDNEDAEDDDEAVSSDYDSDGDSGIKRWRRGGQPPRSPDRGSVGEAEAAAEAVAAAVEAEDTPLTADEFIVKKLLEQGKLERMEAAQMMLE
ncbi:unnamed protein product, partial [Hapterophycus canaliculatus]